MKRSILRDLWWLIGTALFVAILYNLTLGKLPWIRTPKSEPVAPDSLLFQPATFISDTVESGGEHTILTVTYDQVRRLLHDPEVLFIDARPSEEYALGRIGNAINIYALDFESHIPQILAIPKDQRIIVYCGGGNCELSHILANHLKNFGFTRVFIYTGGWHEWSQRHYEE